MGIADSSTICPTSLSSCVLAKDCRELRSARASSCDGQIEDRFEAAVPRNHTIARAGAGRHPTSSDHAAGQATASPREDEHQAIAFVEGRLVLEAEVLQRGAAVDGESYPARLDDRKRPTPARGEEWLSVSASAGA